MVIELDTQYEKQKIRIEHLVKEIINQKNIQISQTMFDNLIIHLSLCVSRELNGTYISTSESQLNILKKHEYYDVADEIIRTIEKEFAINIDKNQISYVTMYLANIHLLDMEFNFTFDLYEDEIENIINETLMKIKEELQVDLKENKEFYNGITLHFFPAIERLKNDLQLTNNPLKDFIKIQHEKEYHCAQILNDIVNKYYHKSFNEHEIAYIALHFGTAFTN